MRYKTILTYLSSMDRAQTVLETAAGLAEKHAAHLIGLHIVPQIPLASIPRHPIPNDMLTIERRRLQTEADGLKRIFADATKRLNGNCEWRVEKAVDDNLVGHILDSIMGVDLVVASQEIDHPFDGVPDLASDLVLSAGRPILIIPGKGQFPTVGERIVVGWKPGREALRAVFDALPILQDARSVHVVSVSEGKKDTVSPSQLYASLARHGVEVTEVLSTETGVGKALLEQVADLGSDLLVMGCYGRLRLSELLFGGATRHILKHMPVPVLMSY